MEWINVAIHIMGMKAGELLRTVSKWHMYAELTQVVRKLGMRQMMFNQKAWSPANECFSGGTRDAIFNSAPSAYFGSLPAMLILYVKRESESHSVLSNSLQPHGLYSPWNSPGQNTGVGSLSLLEGIFPTQGSNPDLPHCRQIL